MNPYCLCPKCKSLHRESERVNRPSKDIKGATVSVCPGCSAQSFYDLSEFEIVVKRDGTTFKARCFGKSAASFSYPILAAESCAKKILPNIKFDIAEKPHALNNYFRFVVTPRGV